MTERCDICVVGAGPAGTVFAARMAQLGHDVCLIERRVAPRPRTAESLAPGIWPLLEAVGARAPVEAARFAPNRRWSVRWETEAAERREARGEAGLVVDRNRFDAVLLAVARAAGVRILRPAVLRRRRYEDGLWQMAVAADGREVALCAMLLADASGRAAALRGHRRATAAATIALHAKWRGADLAREPQIVADAHGWLWGLPLPGALYTTMAFVDATTLRKDEPEALLRRMISQSGLIERAADAELATPVRAADATAYLDSDTIGASYIKLGEAALALDPLSSTGVQKSMHSALAGAIAAHTVLKRPELAETARAFYRDLLIEACERHRRWAGSYYGMAAHRHDTPFWLLRAADEEARAAAAIPGAGLRGRTPDFMVRLSPETAIVDTPCIVGEFIGLRPALRHPTLDRPVAFLGGHELAPLIGEIDGRIRLGELMRTWPASVPLSARPAIADWLLRHEVVVPANA